MDPIRLSSLESEQDWANLRLALDPSSKDVAAENVLKQLKANGAICVVIEEEYLDQDFTASYSAFYSTVFKRYSKICKRFHFFSKDVRSAINDTSARASAEQLQEIGTGSYLGFIVRQPLAHAPLGRVVIKAAPPPPDAMIEQLVYSDHEAHLLGASLKVRGLAMTQQDARVGACAQAAIWMAGRHFHLRHRGPWFSTVDITQAAISPMDASVAVSLPAGSEHLRPDHMARALRYMERRPLFFIADEIDESGSAWTITWKSEKPQDIISRYIDSGIPVILGLAPTSRSAAGHAVLATGRIIKQIDGNSTLSSHPTFAEFCEFFLVNDDRRGTNLRLPVRKNTFYNEVPYNIHEHVAYIIVPLPNKVFMPGEAAEKISWDMLTKYAADWDAHKAQHPTELGTSVSAGDTLTDEIGRGRVIARTYLTYGWKYKARMLRNRISDSFKSVLFYHELPRYVWVTEFGTLSTLNHLDVRRRRILAHNIIDATASLFWENRSIFHAPGMSVRYFHDPDSPAGDVSHAVAPLRDDQAYFPKVRGETDYTRFSA